MNEKFTPGPWEVEDEPNAITPGLYVQKKGGYDVAQISNRLTDGKRERCMMANAELIAAAPDMYTALTDMLSGWRYIREQHGDLYGVGWDRAEDLAATALAKARGEIVDEPGERE